MSRGSRAESRTKNRSARLAITPHQVRQYFFNALFGVGLQIGDAIFHKSPDRKREGVSRIGQASRLPWRASRAAPGG